MHTSTVLTIPTLLMDPVAFRCASGTLLLGVKVALRFYNSHALVNMAVWTKASSSGNGITDARIAVGCPTLFRESSGASQQRLASSSKSVKPLAMQRLLTSSLRQFYDAATPEML